MCLPLKSRVKCATHAVETSRLTSAKEIQANDNDRQDFDIGSLVL